MSTDPASKYNSYGTDFCTLHNDTYPFLISERFDFAGKHVLITGASRGIGFETALSFARAGASAIVLAARSSLDRVIQKITDESREGGRQCPQIIPLAMDVTKKEDVRSAAEKVKATLGHIDILIPNSGYLEALVPMLEQEPEDWWYTWEVNVRGTFMTLRYFLPLVIASPKPDKTVIALSSIGATMAGPGFSSYQPGKLALSRLVEHVVAEYGEKGVLAYSIHPGGVMTDMADRFPDNLKHLLGDTPQLPADTMVWLTGKRREWLAGRYISCKWDVQELEAKRPEIEKRDLLKFRLAMGSEDPDKL